MKERPILFSGPMIRAIMEGRKTMTRRVIKPQPSGDCNFMESAAVNEAWQCGFVPVKCPYGKPGDRLWVRETWNQHGGLVTYRADNDWIADARRWPSSFASNPPVWKPSIHMPRWASRITLEIVSVRVERLNDISEQDAQAEGVERVDGLYKNYCHEKPLCGDARMSFETLWVSINGYESKCANPWVWVIEFKVV